MGRNYVCHLGFESCKQDLKNVKIAVFRSKNRFFSVFGAFFQNKKACQTKISCHSNFQVQTRERTAGTLQSILLYIFDLKTASIKSTCFSRMRTHFFIMILSSCVETWYKSTQQKQKTAKNIDSIKFFAKDIYFFIQNG